MSHIHDQQTHILCYSHVVVRCINVVLDKNKWHSIPNFEQCSGNKMTYSTCIGFRFFISKEIWAKIAQTSNSLQTSGSENHVSSTTTWGVLGLRLNATAEIEEVKTTRLTDGDFAHDLRTLRVPFTAGSSNSAWNKENKSQQRINRQIFFFQNKQDKQAMLRKGNKKVISNQDYKPLKNV